MLRLRAQHREQVPRNDLAGYLNGRLRVGEHEIGLALIRSRSMPRTPLARSIRGPSARGGGISGEIEAALRGRLISSFLVSRRYIGYIPIFRPDLHIPALTG